jgi:hypothetical protein
MRETKPRGSRIRLVPADRDIASARAERSAPQAAGFSADSSSLRRRWFGQFEAGLALILRRSVEQSLVVDAVT